MERPHKQNRDDVILKTLKEELVGPFKESKFNTIKTDQKISLSYDEIFKPRLQSENGEEILTSFPTDVYGVGLLYPQQTENSIDTKEDSSDLLTEDENSSNDEGSLRTNKIGKPEADDYDFDISTVNAFQQSSMAVSFLVKKDDDLSMTFKATGGRYKEKKIKNQDYPNGKGKKEYSWWLRKPLITEWEIDFSKIDSKESSFERKPEPTFNSGAGDIQLQLILRFRNYSKEELICTAALVNRNKSNQSTIDNILFQSHLEISFNNAGFLCSYPESKSHIRNLEDQSLQLLFNEKPTLAVGHGCAADWEVNERVCKVFGTHFPEYEEPLYTPNVEDLNGDQIEIEMATLAEIGGRKNSIMQLKKLVENYREWIENKKAKIRTIEKYREAAEHNLEKCEESIKRMEQGIKLLENDEIAAQAFRLANYSILMQQIRREHRPPYFEDGRIKFEEFPSLDPENLGEGLGKWRPFQIAFILMSLSSTLKEDDPFHDNVELIWFPTGGGKTEAYLGLAAVSMFYRIINDPDDKGVNVIMRYTLRLLTAQQFQRASRLICAMNYVYNEKIKEGHPFSIGIWVGGSTTNNKRSQARKALDKLKERGPRAPENPFLLTECPWCGAKMGPMDDKFNETYPVLGYKQIGDNVKLACPDPKCLYKDELRIYTIDEEIYDNSPTFIIGTVDKFARLAWEPNSKKLFGDEDISPPQLIIQDELHLISGPLGSMVGLYEALIENLCTTKEGIKPKIVCSTATIRRYSDQIKNLFARKNSSLFPHPELEMGDAFFARYLKDEETGDVVLGKKYVGIHAPSLGSMQTAQVRTFSALAQASKFLDKDEYKDPWWTLLLFYNSLRELGGAYTLFKSDIPEHLKNIKGKRNLNWGQIRSLWNVLELTGRASSKEVYKALDQLETVKDDSQKKSYPIDVCLASNIIEVGVDVDRLGVLGIVGQPKTSSQYIQVSGRVGRKPKEKPGLVVTLYSPSKPRDRSHFEKFRTYHEKIYTQVEPTSVTPFSPQVLEKGLFGIMVAYVRQNGIESPDPYPEDLLEDLKSILKERVSVVNSDNYNTLIEKFEKYQDKWRNSDRIEWKTKASEPGLMYAAGSYVKDEWKNISESVPNSMRNVDQECRLFISATSK